MVRPDENVDLLGNKKCFIMSPKFKMVILASYKSDADVKKFCEMIPHYEKM
jgi:hypothetical protein